MLPLEFKTIEKSTISAYYEQDHDRLDQLFKDFQRFKYSDFPRAKEYFVAFKFGLQRHIVWEEEILFPLFEKKTKSSGEGPTAVMRMEHRQIGEHLESIHRKVKAGDPSSDEEEKMLLNALGMHNEKEENVLYPAIDQLTNNEERTAAFEAMKNIPEERYLICYPSA